LKRPVSLAYKPLRPTSMIIISWPTFFTECHESVISCPPLTIPKKLRLTITTDRIFPVRALTMRSLSPSNPSRDPSCVLMISLPASSLNLTGITSSPSYEQDEAANTQSRQLRKTSARLGSSAVGPKAHSVSWSSANTRLASDCTSSNVTAPMRSRISPVS